MTHSLPAYVPTPAHRRVVGQLLARLHEHHPPTARHSMRVAPVMRQLAFACAISRQEAACLSLASRLHDIGKIRFSPHLLDAAYAGAGQDAQTLAFPETGFFLLQRWPGEVFVLAARLALCHREHWDGTGYPQGLSRRRTPFQARLMAVANAYDELRAPHGHGQGRGHDMAMAIIGAAAGTRFDPEIVTSMAAKEESIAQEWEAAYRRHPDSTMAPTTPEPAMAG